MTERRPVFVTRDPLVWSFCVHLCPSVGPGLGGCHCQFCYPCCRFCGVCWQHGCVVLELELKQTARGLTQADSDSVVAKTSLAAFLRSVTPKDLKKRERHTQKASRVGAVTVTVLARLTGRLVRQALELRWERCRDSDP